MKVVVIGGGPAGMLSAISSAKKGNEVIILEKMNMLGKKLLITGKGRCNITSSIPIEEFIKNIPGNGMFMYSSFNNFNNTDIIQMLEKEGVQTKVERGNRVFPVSDSSKDVQQALIKILKNLNVKVVLNAKVEEILVEDNTENDAKQKLQIAEEILVEDDDKQKLQIAMENNLKQEEQSEQQNEAQKKVQKNQTKQQYEIKNTIQKNKQGKLQGIIKVKGVKVQVENEHKKIPADKIILATGGKSYPGTGSTGDGYKIAKKLGHTITKIRPSLVPLTASKENSLKICKDLQGLSLKNVSIVLKDTSKNKVIYEDFGEMLFTHFGVSGPTILSSSAHLLRYKDIDNLMEKGNIVLDIDLKPALTVEKLDERILRDFSEEKNKEFKNSLEKLLPKKMIPVIIELSGIDPDKKVNEITKKERQKLVETLKKLEIKIAGFRPIEEAIITSGGINIKEINPKTMESKLIRGLYFAGEIIDVDAYTGGFNLQIAYSTGYTAGLN